jgi:hypothetical protein
LKTKMIQNVILQLVAITSDRIRPSVGYWNSEENSRYRVLPAAIVTAKLVTANPKADQLTADTADRIAEMVSADRRANCVHFSESANHL